MNAHTRTHRRTFFVKRNRCARSRAQSLCGRLLHMYSHVCIDKELIPSFIYNIGESRIINRYLMYGNTQCVDVRTITKTQMVATRGTAKGSGISSREYGTFFRRNQLFLRRHSSPHKRYILHNVGMYTQTLICINSPYVHQFRTKGRREWSKSETPIEQHW